MSQMSQVSKIPKSVHKFVTSVATNCQKFRQRLPAHTAGCLATKLLLTVLVVNPYDGVVPVLLPALHVQRGGTLKVVSGDLTTLNPANCPTDPLPKPKAPVTEQWLGCVVSGTVVCVANANWC